MLRRHVDGWWACGSAHCRGLMRRWIDEGTRYTRLSAANCGAQPTRTPEELEKADLRLRENIQTILEKSEIHKQNTDVHIGGRSNANLRTRTFILLARV